VAFAIVRTFLAMKLNHVETRGADYIIYFGFGAVHKYPYGGYERREAVDDGPSLLRSNVTRAGRMKNKTQSVDARVHSGTRVFNSSDSADFYSWFSVTVTCIENSALTLLPALPLSLPSLP